MRELHRFEYLFGGSFHDLTLERSWASTKATRRWEVTGLAPVDLRVSN